MGSSRAEQTEKTIAIAGNINVGKTTLFTRICGENAATFKQSGTTAALLRGRARREALDLIDTPGTCSIFSPNEDERMSRDVLLSLTPENRIQGVVIVADAKKLKRSVALLLQYAEYGVPMIFVVNMVDEAESRGISIDFSKLAEILGVPVCPSVATDGVGVDEIRTQLRHLQVPRQAVGYPPQVEEFCSIVGRLLSSRSDPVPRGIPLLLLVNDRSVEHWVGETFGQGMLDQIRSLADDYRRQERLPFNLVLTRIYNTAADGITRQVQAVSPPSRSRLLERFGKACLRPVTGIPVAAVSIALMYLFVGVMGAGWLVDTVKGRFLEGMVGAWARAALAPLPSDFFKALLTDADFGVLPMGLFLPFGLVAPVLLCFYLFFGLLEDSGYLPRLALLLDSLFKRIGLNGKGVLPVVMGFSCVTMALLTVRGLDQKREKLITSFVLFLGIPCAPLLAVSMILLKQLPIAATATVFGIMLAQIFVIGIALNRVLPGERTPLLIEIPPMRLPDPARLLKKSFFRTYFFMKEAIPVFVLAALCVFLFHWYGGLTALEHLLRPLTSGLLGLPETSVQVFIKLLIRKENGAVELVHVRESYTNLQLVVNTVMMMLVPCMNSVIVLFKERGARTAVVILLLLACYNVFVGTMLNTVCRFIGVTFS